MKRLIRNVQTLGEQAARLSSAASQIPGRVAEIRESVNATAGQLQHLKTDIQMNVAGLQMTSENDLAGALAEINAHATALENAGFELAGVDLELSPAQRLVVHLLRIGDADDGEFLELIAQHADSPTIRSILASLQKARQTAETVDLAGLEFHGVMIGIGNHPVVRVSWKTQQGGLLSPPPSASVPIPASSSSSSYFGGGGSFFPSRNAPEPSPSPGTGPHAPEDETHAEAGADAPPIPARVAVPPPLPAATPPPLPHNPADPLARFKVMPRLDKR